MKRMVVASGLIEAQKFGNQSFKNTLIGLDKSFSVTLITMIPEGRREYDFSWYSETSINQKRPRKISLFNIFKGGHKKIASLLKSQ